MDENELVAQPEPAPQAEPQVPEPKPEGEKVDTAPDATPLKDEITRLNEARDKAKKDAEYWRREKANARADYFKNRQSPVVQPAAPAPPQPVNEPRAPRQEEFDDYTKYQTAHTKYVEELADFRATQKIQQWEREQSQKHAEESYQQKMTVLHEKINKGFEKYPDFEDVAMADTVPINQVMLDVLAECDAPEDVTYYLGRNRAEAINISRMTPTAAARAIARIEMQLRQSPSPTPPQNQIKNITGAPPPVKPLGSSNTVQRDLDKLSQREFEAEMEKRVGYRF